MKLLGVHQRTLYQWDEKGKIETIRTPGGKRLYNVKKFIEQRDGINEEINVNEYNADSKQRTKITYVRVSSHSQKDDLERQKAYMLKRFPTHLMIEDIGSGINRKGLNRIIHMAIQGQIEEIVVAYKDRLVRFGFELIEELVTKYSNGRIIILNGTKKEEPEDELVKDMLQIMNIFVAKMNGLRKYRIKEDI